MFNKFAAIIVLTAVFGGLALSAQGKYVRKQLQPDFFIPAKDQFNQPEKLPPLPEELLMEAEQRKQSAMVQTDEHKKDEDNKIVGTPDYQTKFDKYNHDIAILSKSGEMPKNAELESDLAEMNSDDQKAVDDKDISSSETSQTFEKIVDDIITDN